MDLNTFNDLLHAYGQAAMEDRNSNTSLVENLAVPLLNESHQWNKLACYGAYQCVDHHWHEPLRSWAEQACAPRNGSGVS